MLDFEFSYTFYLTERPCHTHAQCSSMAGAREDNMSEFSFTAAVRGFLVYCRVWLPHVGQRLSTEREHGNVDNRFAIAVREHSGTFSWILTARVQQGTVVLSTSSSIDPRTRGDPI